MSALQDRSANTSMPSAENAKTSAPGEENAKAVQAKEHKKLTEQKQSESDGYVNSISQPYISPSDSIMSPASQKLSSFKQKQINKYVRTLPNSMLRVAEPDVLLLPQVWLGVYEEISVREDDVGQRS
nr:hypothetical protein B0A51_00547 [Rachicladosporium sp. CCFEE 5018]